MPDVVQLAGGAPTDILVLVNVDEVTVFGNGAPNNPLSSTGGSVVSYVDAEIQPRLIPGNVVTFGASSGNLVFDHTSATSTLPNAYVSGMYIGNGSAKTGGQITLTEAEWEAVIDGGGAPEVGVPYYVSDVTPANITVTAPTTSGHYVTLVGWFTSINTELSTATFHLAPSTPFAHP